MVVLAFGFATFVDFAGGGAVSALLGGLLDLIFILRSASASMSGHYRVYFLTGYVFWDVYHKF